MSFASFLAMNMLHGLVYGMLLFLIASGLTLVMGLMRITNIAHTSFFMIGAYLTYELIDIGIGFWPALLIVPLTVAALGGVIEMAILNPKRQLTHFGDLLATFSLFFIFNELVLMIWGTGALPVGTPAPLKGTVNLGFGMYPEYRLFILFTALVVSLVLLFVVARTNIGVIIRAVVADPDMAEALGVRTWLIRRSVFAAGAGLAGIAGVIAAPLFQADPLLASNTLLSAFVIVVLGGFGSLGGAFLAALIIGQVQAFGTVFVPELAMVMQLIVLSLVLVFRPQGLFGEAA